MTTKTTTTNEQQTQTNENETEQKETNLGPDEIAQNEVMKKRDIENSKILHNGIPKYKDDKVDLPERFTDHVYVNIEIDPLNSNAASLPFYVTTRDSAIVDKASDYYLSIVRFNIPSYYAPVLELFTQQNDFEVTIYGIYVFWKGTFSDIAYVTIESSIMGDVNNYFDPTPIQNPNGSYTYYLYGYQKFIHWINIAIATAWESLGTKVVGLNPTQYPFMTLNSESKLCTLHFPETMDHHYDEGGDGPPLLYMNERLFNLFSSWDAVRVQTGFAAASDGKDYWIMVMRDANNVGYADRYHEEINYYTINVPQNYSTLYLWNPFKRIILLSALLPIRSEYIRQNGNSTLKTITDFIPINDINEVRSTFQYNPSVYRLIDLINDDEIRTFDISVAWEDKNGNFRPLYMPPNNPISIKLAFFNKEIYHNNHLSGYQVL